MRHAKPWIVLLVLSALTACSTTPEIPDEQKTYNYSSTEKDKSADNKTNTATNNTTTNTTTKPESNTLMKAKGPVAVVNGKEITAETFNGKVQELAASGRIPVKYINKLKERLVRGMVDKMLLDQAVAKANLTITDADIDAKIKEIRTDFERIQKLSGGQAGSFEQLLKRMGIQPKNMRESIKQAIIIERLVKKSGYKPMEEAEVKKFYDANVDKFQQKEGVRARHILIKVASDGDKAAWDKAKKEVSEIRADIIKNKKDFGEVAKTKSQGPSNKRGGDLGFFGKGQMVKPFEDAVFAMKDGEISQPVKTRFGWHIIKRVEYRKKGPIPFDKIKDVLKSQLNNKKFQQALMGYIETLRKDGKVVYKFENIS